jgi:RNA polymerase sigma factor (sigma-70 family)
MQPTDDGALLRQFVETRSDEAFGALVTRHINLVYSVALRQVGQSQDAEEITQAVFIILAKKAAQLRHDKALASWLFQATRLTAGNFVRSQSRRHHREEEAYMQSVLDNAGTEAWPKIAPLLDAAVAALREKDRQAIVHRFYEGRNLRDVGLALGVSEDAAEKRVHRALEKLRKFFTKRGADSTTAIFAETISANSVQAAPVALAKAVTAVAIAKGAAATASTLTLVKGALKIMAWTKMKMAVVAGVGILLAIGTAAIVVSKAEPLPPLKSPPNPNGYDDLLKAGAMVSSDNLNFNSANLAQLHAMTAANAEALALARVGLSKECGVPLQFTQAYSEKHLNELTNLKKLALAFVTEGKMAELENRPQDAAKSYLDTMYLANASSRGGVLVDELLGLGIEGVGTAQLTNLVRQLDAKSCRETASALEAFDMQRQTWDETVQQEKAWSRRTFTGISYDLQRIMQKKSIDDILAAVKQKNQKYPKFTRQLIIQLAARAYALDKGKPPGNVDDLVPDYLKAVPLDPTTGNQMVYAPK